MLAPTTPVLIGAGTATQRFDDPLAGSDAMGLMRTALDAAVADAGGSARSLLDRVDEILSLMRDERFIFNLGHGIVPQTPPENVARLVERVRGSR